MNNYLPVIRLTELKNKEWWISHISGLLFIFVSVFYFVITCYKLTYSPLWFDEAIEFYYSLHLFSAHVPVPGTHLLPQDGNMYQKIISTFQPPLYNFLMFFWLKISESEWWFRFAGVLAGYFGTVGIYRVIKQYCNWKWSLLSMLAFFSTYQVLYFIQECAEYNLLLAFIPWTIYFFFRVLEKKSWKNIILFIVFSILPVYSQYGAVFIVAPMLLLVFVDTVISKDWCSLKKLSIGYICALVFTAVPLYVFFLKPQIAHQPVKTISGIIPFFYGNIIHDFFKSFFDIFKWNMIPHSFIKNPAIVPAFSIFIFILIILCSYSLLKSKDKILKYLIITNIITLCLYYFAVKTKIYAYPVYAKDGWNGFFSRYGLFFIPLWVPSFFYITYNSFKTFHCPKLYKKMLLVFTLFFSFCGIITYSQHGKKLDNLRDIADKWYSLEDIRYKKTILTFWSISSFYYYFTHHKNFSEELEKNVLIKYNLSEFFSENFKTLDSFYLVASRYSKIEDYVRNSAAKYGYKIKTIYSHNGSELLLLTRSSK